MPASRDVSPLFRVALSAFVLSATAARLAAQGPALVGVAPVVERSDMEAGQAFVGTVQPARRSTVGSAVDGRVVEFLVREGDQVKKGQPLAKLLTETLEIQIAGAKAELELRQQEYAELANGSRAEEIDEAKARMLSAKSVAEYAEHKLVRTRTLVEQNAASVDQLQDHASAASAASQLYAAALAHYDLVKAGPRAERVAQGAANVAIAEQNVRKLEDQLTKHTMIAPFDGYVVREYTQVGQWITSGELVAEIVEVADIDVVIEVLETYMPFLRVGAAARVALPGLPNEPLAGVITQIVPQADVQSRSFPVKVRLKNKLLEDGQPLIKPGMFARVTLAVDHRQKALMVPKDAIVLRGGQAEVYVADANPKQPGQRAARRVTVTTGAAFEGFIEVAGELKAGELVVVEGNERLRPGAELRLIEEPATGGAPAQGAKL